MGVVFQLGHPALGIHVGYYAGCAGAGPGELLVGRKRCFVQAQMAEYGNLSLVDVSHPHGLSPIYCRARARCRRLVVEASYRQANVRVPSPHRSHDLIMEMVGGGHAQLRRLYQVPHCTRRQLAGCPQI